MNLTMEQEKDFIKKLSVSIEKDEVSDFHDIKNFRKMYELHVEQGYKLPKINFVNWIDNEIYPTSTIELETSDHLGKSFKIKYLDFDNHRYYSIIDISKLCELVESKQKRSYLNYRFFINQKSETDNIKDFKVTKKRKTIFLKKEALKDTYNKTLNSTYLKVFEILEEKEK